MKSAGQAAAAQDVYKRQLLHAPATVNIVGKHDLRAELRQHLLALQRHGGRHAEHQRLSLIHICPVAINEFEKAGFDAVFDKTKISLVMDHFVPLSLIHI